MKFLVPVDFTEITNPLLRLLKKLAQAHQADVALLHTVSPPFYFPYPESFGVNTIDLQIMGELQESKKEEAKQKLTGLAEFLKPLKVELLVEVGEPAEAILEREKDYYLIFMGSHKKGLIERILIGSTTEKVVKYSHKPILVLKGKEPQQIKRVLVGYDFSEHARKALDFAITLLKPFSPQLTLLHVEETIELPVVEGIRDVLSEKYKEEKLKHMESLSNKLKEEGLEVDVHMIQDTTPQEGIRDFIREHSEVDMVVLGSRGLSGLKRVLLGSTSSQLLRSVEIPILIHRNGE
ncbi:MAG: universal stress protein [Aquificaceae bacterium]|nr:universal stress protein [Aquificaceae bacterium]MCS7307474.1 universal stress protein [Aquificaceae bacterium]MCX8076901.1 universal stress protein [Aquificaceae bacterium]MDW8095853.1 universal stress protein [Aquificaceae bacterium]